MPKRLFIRRKITKMGDSLGMSLPKDLVNTYNLKEGEYLTIIFDADMDSSMGDHYLMVVDLKGRKGDDLWTTLDKAFE